MDKKDPIPFRAKRRERQQRVRPATPGELDDFRVYWSRFFRGPFKGPGRDVWTERMLWGNALFAGLVRALATLFTTGFSVLYMVTVLINTFFVFFLVYYIMSWVMNWILVRWQLRTASTGYLRLEMIVLSGFLVVMSLLPLIPSVGGYAYPLGMVGFGVLVVIHAHRAVRASWTQSMISTLGGGLAVIAIQILLSHL